jgi:hypothetical protein
MPGGFYSPITQGRQVTMPGGLQAMVGRLVSYHEAMHQFLNQSTTFGCGMMLVGSLIEAGELRFHPLLSRMVKAARETHETLATVSSVCTASGGSMNPDLLSPFPDYQRFLTSFHSVFGEYNRPFLANIALMSSARAAMQTEICVELFGDVPDVWPEFFVADSDTPDTRFALLHRPELAVEAMGAIDNVLSEIGDIGQALRRGVAPAEEHTLISRLDPTHQDALSSAAFTTYGDALEMAGYLRPRYDAQRLLASWAIRQIRQAFGDRLKTHHVVAAGIADDMEAVLLDFRREVLVFREKPDPAVVIACDGSELASPANFVLANDGLRYLQLVAMPIAKLKSLYSFEHGAEALDAYGGEVATALRRRWVFPDGRSRVELLLIRRDDLAEFSATNRDVGILPLISAAATGDSTWRQEWLTPGRGLIDRVFVLLDIDPFAFLQKRGAVGKLRWARLGLRMQAGADEAIEILCLIAADQPSVLYLTPCTIPFRQAVVEFLGARRMIETMAWNVPDEWGNMLPRVLGHLVREESKFGSEFWR